LPINWSAFSAFDTRFVANLTNFSLSIALIDPIYDSIKIVLINYIRVDYLKAIAAATLFFDRYPYWAERTLFCVPRNASKRENGPSAKPYSGFRPGLIIVTMVDYVRVCF
jgi:hypothetical protein